MSDSHKDSCHTVMRVPHDICTGCAACYAVCPVSCIAMEPDVEGFVYPKVDLTACTNCGLCVKTCPVLKEPAAREPIDVYAAINKDEEVRARSSSGGVFWELGANCINQGGVVFGAGWSSDLRVIHKSARTLAVLKDLQGSKYVQSDIGDTYQEAKKLLDAGVQVLFSGTPCQIAGLRAFLRKEYDHLLCVDLICNSVPSPLVFAKYKDKLVEDYGRAEHISHRDKRHGWKHYSFSFTGTEGMKLVESLNVNTFLRGFSAQLYNRPSCYACRFRELKGGSDITLADYWNVHHRFPELDDDKGTSLVLVNTIKGETYLNDNNDCFHLCKSDFEEVKQWNPAIMRASKQHTNRQRFFRQLGQGADVNKLIKAMLHVSFYRRVIRKGIRIARTLSQATS